MQTIPEAHRTPQTRNIMRVCCPFEGAVKGCSMAHRGSGAEGSWKVRRAKLLRLVKDVFGHDGFRGRQEASTTGPSVSELGVCPARGARALAEIAEKTPCLRWGVNLTRKSPHGLFLVV